MKITIKDILLVILIGLLIWTNFREIMGWSGVETRTDVDTKIERVVVRDTVERIIEKVIIKEPIVQNVTKTIQLPIKVDTLNNEIPGEMVDVEIPLHIYEDTLEVDGATLSYSHDIYGFLENSNYAITYPRETITKTVTNTVTEQVFKTRVFDLFMCTSIETQGSFKGGVDAVFPKWKVGYRYGNDPILGAMGGRTDVHTIEFGYKIFSF